jgi:transposase InsO family protein
LTHSEACRQFEISRPTGYEWLERYKQEGETGLRNRSSARKTQNNQTSEEIKKRILNIKYEFPTWGPKKIIVKLNERYPAINWPGTTTLGNILKANGLVKSRKTRRRLPVNTSPLTSSEGSNDIWCMDFKGWILTNDRHKFDPFTLTDHYSRYILRCLKLDFNDTNHVWAILDMAFREYGLPKIIRSDNGPPFATCCPGRLSPLSIKLIKAGVMPEWIEPGKPYQNGRHERMHLTMENESFYPETLDLQEQIMKLIEFQLYYNFERPHEALGQKTPGSIYVPSNRIWTGKLQPIEYSKEYIVRKVRSCGNICWKQHDIYTSRFLQVEYLGIKEDDNGFGVYFGPIYLGSLKNEKELEVTRREIRKKYKKQGGKKIEDVRCYTERKK